MSDQTSSSGTLISSAHECTSELYSKLFPEKFAAECFKQNQSRTDGRKATDQRKIEISTDIISTANSSSLVKFGRTTVIVGIKLAVGVPSAMSPRCGDLDFQVHFTPICSTKFSIGRQPDEAHHLSSTLTRLFTGPNVIDMEELLIVDGKSAWKLCVDVFCVDDDGNVADAAILATTVALKNLYLPQVQVSEDDAARVAILKDGTPASLNVKSCPVSLSFVLLNGQLLVDPTHDEEQLKDSDLQVVCTSDGKIYSIKKSGGLSFSASDLSASIKMAQQMTKQVSQKYNLD